MSNYQITAFNASTGSILVSYLHNGETFVTYNVDIPLDENNNFIVGEALDTYISGMFPVATLARSQALKAGIANAAEIQALVVLPVLVPPTTLNTEFTSA
jgi:hypothetical protein